MDIDSVIAGLAKPKPGCWASHLEGEPAELLAAIEAFEDEGGFVDRRLTAAKFNEYGSPANDNAVKRHLNRECKCRPPR